MALIVYHHITARSNKPIFFNDVSNEEAIGELFVVSEQKWIEFYRQSERMGLTTELRVESIKDSTGFVNNIIVGIPLEKIIGSTEIIPFTPTGGCEIQVTDYYFKVTNWIFGYPGEDIIRVRSQIGDIFEIGVPYTFSVIHQNNVFAELYFVNWHTWILRNGDVSDYELNSLHDTIAQKSVRYLERQVVIEEAVPTAEFIQKVDTAIIATVKEMWEDEYSFNISILLELNDVVYGEVRHDVFNEFIRLRGDIIIGNKYLIINI